MVLASSCLFVVATQNIVSGAVEAAKVVLGSQCILRDSPTGCTMNNVDVVARLEEQNAALVATLAAMNNTLKHMAGRLQTVEADSAATRASLDNTTRDLELLQLRVELMSGTRVIFDGPVNSSYTALPGELTKTSRDRSWKEGAWTHDGIASATSQRRGVRFRCATAGAGSRVAAFKTIGLSSATKLITYSDGDVYGVTDYGVMCRGDGGKATIVMLSDNTALLGDNGMGVYTASTVFEIRIEGQTVQWYADGVCWYTYSPSGGITYPLRVLATSYNTQPSFVNEVEWASGSPPPPGLVVFNGPYSPGVYSTTTPGEVSKLTDNNKWSRGVWTHDGIASATSQRRGVRFRCATAGRAVVSQASRR